MRASCHKQCGKGKRLPLRGTPKSSKGIQGWPLTWEWCPLNGTCFLVELLEDTSWKMSFILTENIRGILESEVRTLGTLHRHLVAPETPAPHTRLEVIQEHCNVRGPDHGKQCPSWLPLSVTCGHLSLPHSKRAETGRALR